MISWFSFNPSLISLSIVVPPVVWCWGIPDVSVTERCLPALICMTKPHLCLPSNSMQTCNILCRTPRSMPLPLFVGQGYQTVACYLSNIDIVPWLQEIVVDHIPRRCWWLFEDFLWYIHAPVCPKCVFHVLTANRMTLQRYCLRVVQIIIKFYSLCPRHLEHPRILVAME